MNFLKLFTIIPAIIAFVRGIFDVVKHIEDITVPGTPGEDKRAAAIATSVAAVTLAGDLGLPGAAGVDKDKLAGVVGGVIDTVVDILNALGVFKHAAAPAA